MAGTPAPRVGTSNVATDGAGGGTSGREAADGRGRRLFNPRGSFIKEINQMMYAFGDVRNPNPAAAAILEEMTIDFLIDLCMRARPSPLAVPQVDQSYPPVGRLKVKVDDFKHALRKDPKKLNRLEELLYMDTQIKQTKKTLDVDQFAKDEAEQQQRLFAEAAAQSSMAEPQKESETNALADESEESQRTAKRRKSTAETAGKGSKKGKGKERESGRGRSGSPTAMEE